MRGTKLEYFDVDEQIANDGAILVIKARNGFLFENGKPELKIVVKRDYGPRIGERVMCGKVLVKVADKRYDSKMNVQVMDEDTKVWFKWESDK